MSQEFSLWLSTTYRASLMSNVQCHSVYSKISTRGLHNALEGLTYCKGRAMLKANQWYTHPQCTHLHTVAPAPPNLLINSTKTVAQLTSMFLLGGHQRGCRPPPTVAPLRLIYLDQT